MNLTLYCDADVDAELRRAMEEADAIEAGTADALLPPPQNGLEELSRQKRDVREWCGVYCDGGRGGMRGLRARGPAALTNAWYE